MRRIGTVITLLVFAMPAWTQGSRRDDIVFGPAGHPLFNATATVCASSATGTPCSPLAQLPTDDPQGVTAPNPLQTDGLGDYHLYAAPGRYELQFSATGVQGASTLNHIILPSDPFSLRSLSTSGTIRAETMSLGGNLNVSGNAAVAGSPTVNGGPVPSTAVQSFSNGPYFRSGSPWFDVKGFCASGSQQQTKGTITRGQTALTLASAIDFAACPAGSGQPGEGITIYHAGPAPTIAAPTGVSVTPVGGTATSSYGYELVANDYAGGVTAPTAAVTTSAGEPVGSLSATVYNMVCFTPSANAASYTLYRSVSGGAYAYVATFWDSTPPSAAFCYHDTNYNQNGQSWGNATTTIPDWGSSTVPSAAANDWCQTTIASGMGTPSLTLSASCPNSASGTIVKHDDTPAIQSAVNAANTGAGGTVTFPQSGNFNMGKMTWPPEAVSSVYRGWIILDVQGQISLTYPLIFASTGTAPQNKIRVTGSRGSSAASSQFPFTNVGFISSGFVSPAIHVFYENSVPVYPIVIDHVAIYNRGIGGGDGIVNDGGNSGGLYISNVDIAVTGTPLKVGYSSTFYGTAADGPCTLSGGFGLYVDHSTFTSFFNGNPLTNCDGWTIDINFGLAYFDHITLIGQGIHTMGMGTTDWSWIYEESGTTTGFLTWDTSVGACSPQCGSNTFRHVELSDPISGGNQYFIYTVNGSSTPPLGFVQIDNVEGIQGSNGLVGGTTPFYACQIDQEGPTTTNLVPGMCNQAAGVINGSVQAFTFGSAFTIPPNMATGINNFHSLNVGGIPGGRALGIQGPIGYTNDYIDVYDPSSTVSSQTIQASIDGKYIMHAYAFQQNAASMQQSWFGPLGKFVGGTSLELSASGSNSALGLKVSGSGDPLFIYDTSGALQTYADSSGAWHTAKAINSTLATGTAPFTVASTTPVANLTAQYAQTTQFTGTTPGIGGSALTAGQCSSGTVAIAGAAASMSVAVSPATDPGTGFVWEGFVSAANTITVRLCNVGGGTLTPTSSRYNVRVIQ